MVGVLFLTLGWKARRWGAVTAGAMWLVYAAYETGMKQRWLCTGECNIRVDLLLIFPVLVVSSIFAGLSLRQANRAGEPTSRRQKRR